MPACSAAPGRCDAPCICHSGEPFAGRLEESYSRLSESLENQRCLLHNPGCNKIPSHNFDSAFHKFRKPIYQLINFLIASKLVSAVTIAVGVFLSLLSISPRSTS